MQNAHWHAYHIAGLTDPDLDPFFFLKKSLLGRKNVMKGFETSELEVTERDKLRVRPSTRAPTVLAVLEQMVGHRSPFSTSLCVLLWGAPFYSPA